MMKNYKGVYSALMTPFKADGSVDYDALKRLADFCIDSGLSVFMSAAAPARAFC